MSDPAPVVAEQVVRLVAKWAATIADLIVKLLRTIKPAMAAPQSMSGDDSAPAATYRSSYMLTARRIPSFLSGGCPTETEIVSGGRENHVVTTVEEDRTQARVDGLLQVLRDAETDFRRSYARVLEVVAELDAEKAGAVAGFGTTARLLAGVLNLSTAEAKARTEQAGLLAPRRSLTGQTLPPALPATAAELAAGAIGPTHLRVITATMRRIPPGTHPGTAAEAEQTLATAARRFDPAALARIGERLLAHLDPDGSAPAEEPETMRELRVRTGPDGAVSLSGKLDPEGGALVLEVLNSLNGRRPPVEGVADLRTPARRNADALVDAMSGLLNDGELPSRGGQRPHLAVTMKLSDLHRRPRHRDPGHRRTPDRSRSSPPRLRRLHRSHGAGQRLDAPGCGTPAPAGHRRHP